MSYNKKVIILVSSIVALLLLVIILSVFVRRGGYNPERLEILEEEGRVGEQAEEYQDELENVHEFVSHLPYYGNGFEVHYGIEDHDNFIVFYEIIIRPSPQLSEAEYNDEVLRLIDHAKQWASSVGADIDEIDFNIRIGQ